jgi:hypothetical protein
MPFMGSGTYVRPLALFPLVLLLPVLLVRLKRGEIAHPWPGSLTILLAFSLVALGATAFGATLAPIELRGVDFYDRALRAVVTLVIGFSFFVAAVWMNQSEADLKFSVKWLLAGLVAHLLWGAVQFIGLNNGYRAKLLQIQNLFSVRGLVKNKRISGFAYEPSWLAGQIAALYLPWLVASVLMRYRALGVEPTSDPTENNNKHLAMSPFKELFRPGRLKSFIEPMLFLATLTGLLMTYSRSGLLIAFLAGAVTFVLVGKETISAFWAWVRAGFDRRRWAGFPAAVKIAGSRILLAVLALAVLAGAFAFLADKGYIAAFFKSEKTDLVSYAQDVYLGPRLAYAAAALTAFDEHPLTGVGLGASGFGIYQNMPDWVLSGEPEIARQMSPASDLYPNSKNLFVRLLTETGLLGFVLFMAFYLALFADALSLIGTGIGKASGPARWLAAAGIFALTAVVLQGVSQDSFAMPEMWINLGILAGAAGAFTQITKKQKELA